MKQVFAAATEADAGRSRRAKVLLFIEPLSKSWGFGLTWRRQWPLAATAPRQPALCFRASAPFAATAPRSRHLGLRLRSGRQHATAPSSRDLPLLEGF